MLDSYRLDNKNILKGKWAISLNELISDDGIISNKAISGNLELNNGKITLDLNGRLTGVSLSLFDDIEKIYGYLSNNLYVVLEKCYLINPTIISNGYNVEKYISNYAYIISLPNNDVSVLKDQEVYATRAKFSFSYLNDWYNIDHPILNYEMSKDPFSIKYINKFSNENNFNILDNEFTIKIKRDIRAIYKANKGSSVKMYYYIEVISNNCEVKSIREFYEVSQWFMKLIDFLTQSKKRFSYIKFYLEDENNKFQSKSLDNGDYDYEYPIYYGQFIFRQLDEQNQEPKFNSLRLSDIKEDLETIICNWFKYKEKLKPVIDLYTQNYIPTLDIESILVNQTEMMERLYDNFFNSARETQNCEDSNLDNTILEIKDYLDKNNIEISIKEEITRRLGNDKKNYPTFREKLTVILENIPEQLKNIFYLIDQNWKNDTNFEKNFANRLKDTRNYNTHGPGNNKNKSRLKAFKELNNANTVLEYIIYYHVIHQLGITDDILLNYPFLRRKIH